MSLLLLTFCSLLLKLSCPIEWSRLIAYSSKLQTATWRLSIGSPIFWQINARNNSCSTKLLNSRLENKASRKYDALNARNLLFRKQISTGCRPISDLWSETKRLNQGQSKEYPWSGLVKDMILSSLTSSFISLYLPLMQYAFFLCRTTNFFLLICCKRLFSHRK